MDDQLNYPLTADSIVVEVGGWRGDWTAKIVELYDPWILIFEPIREYYEACLSRFQSSNKVAIVPEALGAADGKAIITKKEQASSLFLDQSVEETEEIEIADAVSGLPPVVDLLSLNCEGAEFLILPRLIETGVIRNCINVQIQFHQFVLGAEAQRDAIREKLALTHEEVRCVPFSWESWRRK